LVSGLLLDNAVFTLAQIFVVIVFDGVQACKRPETK